MCKHVTILAALCGCLFGVSSAEAQNTGYVYAYFKGPWPTGGDSGVFLSYSEDGYNFQDMNGGNAVLQTQGMPGFGTNEDQMRDPSVVYGPDGKYHMVWTTAATDVNRNIGYAWSYDLKTWNDVQTIEMWDAASTPNIEHTWAPEIEYNGRGEYEIIFTANPYNGLPGYDSYLYLWSTTTTDFVNFTTPVEAYNGGVNVIDGDKTYNPATGTYFMPMEDAVAGQPNDISVATSLTGEPGTWSRDPSLTIDIFNKATEGPSLIQIDGLWHLYFDYFGDGILGMATSPDLVNWTESSAQATLPAGRHGTVFTAPVDTIAFDYLPYGRSDLDGNETIDANDWLIFVANHLADLSGLTPEQQAALGDLNGDGVNNFADFREFKDDFDAYNGAGRFQQMLSTVPEPATSLSLIVLGMTTGIGRSHRERGGRCSNSLNPRNVG